MHVGAPPPLLFQRTLSDPGTASGACVFGLSLRGAGQRRRMRRRGPPTADRRVCPCPGDAETAALA